MKNDEMITLAKFLAISGIILPMLPDDNLIPGINLTPYSIWLATVVVSGISYLSYLLKRYVFRESGILVSGIVGGLYSSTATISVLARKSRKVSAQEAPEYVAAMLLAVSMMFLRFLYPDRNIQCRGFDSHLSVFVDNVCRCCRDGVVPAFPVEASCYVGNGR